MLTQKERNEVSHYEVVCRKYVKESDADHDANEAARDQASLMSMENVASIRLPRGFTLSRNNLKPNMVGAIGDWTEEYVVGSGVAHAFENSGFSGFSLLPIFRANNRSPHEGFAQLFCNTILKAATIDCSVERITSPHLEEHGHLRHLGCLSYAQSDLVDTPDFCRRAESWAGWHGWPSWVVRAKVCQAFTAHKLRGWAFRPVLIRNSNLYAYYLGQWERLRRLVAQCTKSIFDGGRW